MTKTKISLGETISYRTTGHASIARMVLAIGGVFALAACSSSVVRDSTSTNTAGSVRSVRGSTPKPGATVVVQRGDNLYRIASGNGITVGDLAAWNGIPLPYTIYPGQRLRLYPPSNTGSSTVGTSPRRTAPVAKAPRPAAAVPRSPVAVSAAAPITSGINWRWPADGALISRYVAGEPTKQGVDIAGSGGAPVHAAGDGVVVYSGSGLVGYGELIIIKHNDAWLSAYGHNRNRLVNEGQLVKGGQQIAEMGRSGAARDMLHFEVRYNGKPVDPLQYLPKR
jgi:lipoprotein NlpD